MKENKKRKGITETSSGQVFDIIAGLIEKARQKSLLLSMKKWLFFIGI